MEKLRNRRLPASLLLEGLIALAMFGILTTLVLGELGQSRQQRLEELRQAEVLRVAKMAIQTRQDQLTINQVSVQVEKSAKSLKVYQEGKVVIAVEKK
ncbi:competence type IV pilus minor pilin ComGE [Streptococcus australis]|uniref:competence type IV pilus minor pilin ComGE n=1 Tax=Streptococcus australis TaxID=113107 RepID=UPI000F68E483|nr:competence type IV pilus minor pilin ComGE [Streptococcus australis]RSJ97389.1 Type II secretory pathway pseudopilin [Streptococcus australis]